MFLDVAKVVAVSALPVKSPKKSVELTDVKPVIVVSKLSVTSPVAPPPFKLVPAITFVISPKSTMSEIRAFLVLLSVTS